MKHTVHLMKKKDTNHYFNIIDQIEKVRSRNNVNWMDVLRLAFRHAPEEARMLMKKINQEDDQISALLKRLEQ